MTWIFLKEVNGWRFERFDDFSSIRMIKGNTSHCITSDGAVAGELISNNIENPIEPASIKLVEMLIEYWKQMNTFELECKIIEPTSSEIWIIVNYFDSSKEAEEWIDKHKDYKKRFEYRIKRGLE